MQEEGMLRGCIYILYRACYIIVAHKTAIGGYYVLLVTLRARARQSLVI